MVIHKLISCIWLNFDRMIRGGEFGHKEYFQELCDTVDGGDDFYLVANDFASYLEAQVLRQVQVDLIPLNFDPRYYRIV